MSARDEVLGRVRAALADRAPVPEVLRDYRGADAPDDRDLVELLVDRLVDYEAEVLHATPATVAKVIADAVGARRVVVPEGFPSGWVLPSVAPVEDDALTPAQLDAVDGVLTTSRVAIAETGTIVLDGGPGMGRRAVSLVPDWHLCVVAAEDVVSGVPQSLPRLDPARALTWISGPSATSDIELERVEGVHGPRTLVVVLVS